jgi:hypothetical protein
MQCPPAASSCGSASLCLSVHRLTIDGCRSGHNPLHEGAPQRSAPQRPTTRLGSRPAVDQLVVETGGTDWLTPAATLLAVVIGGGITFWVQHLLNRTRQKGEAKAAARVVQGDLGVAASRLKDFVVDDPRWFGFDDLRLPHWAEQQGILALELSADDWEVVSQSALESRWLSESMDRAFAPGGPHEGAPFVALSENAIGRMRLGWENATKAYNVLAPLAENEPVSGLLHEELAPVEAKARSAGARERPKPPRSRPPRQA